jgi:hypothetical protein
MENCQPIKRLKDKKKNEQMNSVKMKGWYRHNAFLPRKVVYETT